jgi:hypothetical protein
MKRAIQVAAAAMFAAATFSPAQALVVGTADSGSSFPFGTYLGGTQYQQVYSASQFGAGLNITDISFYQTQYPGGTPNSATFTLYLSTVSAGNSIATFDSSAFVYSPNASFTQVFSGLVPTVTDGKLNFHLSTAFNYLASAGNLMLTVVATGLQDGSGFFLDGDRGNANTNSRFSAYSYDWNLDGKGNSGLVTGFNDGSNSAPGETPIPAVGAGIPLILGAGGLVSYFRRRKVAKAA